MVGMKRLKHHLIVLIICLITGFAGVGPTRAGPTDSVIPTANPKIEAIQFRDQKAKASSRRAADLIGAGIKSGLSILDIGAGLGDFSFEISRKMQGQGEVFATEIDPLLIEQMKTTIAKEKIKNVFPTLVKPVGIDPFYRSHSFDLVMASQVYQYLTNPKEFFDTL